MNLHPGIEIALKRDNMTELDVMKHMAMGELSSPQPFENMMLWKMRFTGTGFSERPQINEFVLRPKSEWFTPDALERISSSGVPLIWEHPPDATLDSKEFGKRIIGTVGYAFIEGDDIDVITRVYDGEANSALLENKLSTSPTVVFGNLDVNKSIPLEGKSELLVEGMPSYIDHLAVCELGVWDKGGPPEGVRSDSIGDTSMADSKSDDGNLSLKHIADAIADMCKRMDAMESRAKDDDDRRKKDDDDKKKKDDDDKKKKDDDDKKKDDDRHLAKHDDDDDKKKKDDDDDRRKKDDDDDDDKKKKDDRGKGPPEFINDKKKADDDDDDDKKKADAVAKELADTKARLAALEKKYPDIEARLPKARTDEDHYRMVTAQAKADSVYLKFGKRAPIPLDGETEIGYRRRIAQDLKQHGEWKDAELAHFPEGPAFDKIESKVYADAIFTAEHPADLPEGQLREVKNTDETGRTITSFHSRDRTFIHDMGRDRRIVGRLGLPKAS
jgi:hypothetical protein